MSELIISSCSLIIISSILPSWIAPVIETVPSALISINSSSFSQLGWIMDINLGPTLTAASWSSFLIKYLDSMYPSAQIFSFLICIKILQMERKAITPLEIRFLMVGGTVTEVFFIKLSL